MNTEKEWWIDGACLVYKNRLFDVLIEQVPGILNTADPGSGRFGSGIWTCRDQHPMYPLALAYATESNHNPYFHDPDLLAVIVKSADPLIKNMDRRGRWIFQKKDGSTWENISMPWTYSRWIRTFGLIRGTMPAEQKKVWSEALLLGYTEISRTQLDWVHNIPTHHAMGLYAAGMFLDRSAWCRQARKFMAKAVEHQFEGGYWSENSGPVVNYGFTYVDALGAYYAMSGDRQVLPALQKAGAFHQHCTYPDGKCVETVDERNPYRATINPGNVGFTFTPAGRSYLHNQWSLLAGQEFPPDLIASLLLHGEEGEIQQKPGCGEEGGFVLREENVERAMTLRKGPWFVCLSAYTAPVSTSRWIQDRQNLVSIYHDKTGLILGGGSTKLQPAWSNFTVGDTTLLRHSAGDTDPDFLTEGELYHVPQTALLIRGPDPGLDLRYGPEDCRIRIRFLDDRTIEYTVESTAGSALPATAHLTLLPHLNQTIETSTGESIPVGDTPVELSPAGIGGEISYAGYRIHLPPSASLHWPRAPHNPYRKDGHAATGEARIEVRVPLTPENRKERIVIEIDE